MPACVYNTPYLKTKAAESGLLRLKAWAQEKNQRFFSSYLMIG